MFILNQPREIIAGSSSGLKSIAKSIGIGLVAGVAAPIIGGATGGKNRILG